jgi:hypothetical protein
LERNNKAYEVRIEKLTKEGKMSRGRIEELGKCGVGDEVQGNVVGD